MGVKPSREPAGRSQDEPGRPEDRWLSRIVEGTPIATFVIDCTHTITHCNRAFEALTGLRSRETIGTRIQWLPFYPSERPVMADFIVDDSPEHEIRTYYGDTFRKSEVTEGGYEAEGFFPGLGERGRWLFFTAAPLRDTHGELIGAIETLQDITREKRMTQSTGAMLRISMALPEYPDLEELLDYVSNEIKRLMGSEAAFVLLRDEDSRELFFQGVAYGDHADSQRVREIRFHPDELVAGRVIRTGEPVIVSDTGSEPELHRKRDEKLGYHTRNLLLVPLRSSDRTIGVLSAINKHDGDFDQTDVELLSTIAATVVLSIENARFSEEIKKAYREVSNLNRAKDKVINHLSHELKTPASVLAGSLNVLERKLSALADDSWKRTLERARNNVERILEIQYVVDDIMLHKHYRTFGLLPMMLDHCIEEMETLVDDEGGAPSLVERIRSRFEELFGPRDPERVVVALDEFVAGRLDELAPRFSHRNVSINTRLAPDTSVCIPLDPLEKIVDGLVRNAVENTPDEGRIELAVDEEDGETVLTVRDYGVGITEEARRRVFEGFFTTQDTMAYSSKRPFDFNAGGKGADLLRMKIFAERYNFIIDMESSRCVYIPRAGDTCAGTVSECPFCASPGDCRHSGGTLVTVRFPPAGDTC